FDIQNLISFGDDLINLLNSKNGFDVVSQSFDHSEALHFACDEDLNRIQESIKDCKKKLEAYKKKADEAYSDVSARDDEIERLQRELDEDMELERKINAERRVVADELKDLKAQWASIDEKRQSLKRKERDDLRAEKKLSMYACVTKVIPEADVNDPFKISGYMVDREKRVEKFQLETNKMTAHESCNSMWSIINKQ
ncbi:kinetochore protein SPC24 homolog, partial [Brassica napus]|uniref:kinetochore protein SPC24 homolog n=1 Tax=Brassica napus TaxID=3708 RepID=UPI0006AB1459